MGHDHEAMMLVRAELCERLEGLRGVSRRGSAADFSRRVEGMRAVAAAYGMIPVVRLAEALERAVREGGPQVGECRTGPYLSRLEDAIGCAVVNEQAGQAMLASVSVRFSA